MAAEIFNKTLKTNWIIYEKLHNCGTKNITDFKLQQGDMLGNIQYLHWFLCFVYEACLPFNDHFK